MSADLLTDLQARFADCEFALYGPGGGRRSRPAGETPDTLFQKAATLAQRMNKVLQSAGAPQLPELYARCNVVTSGVEGDVAVMAKVVESHQSELRSFVKSLKVLRDREPMVTEAIRQAGVWAEHNSEIARLESDNAELMRRLECVDQKIEVLCGAWSDHCQAENQRNAGISAV